MCQVEGGEAHEFEQILPTPQLLEIYKRITEREIAVHGEEEQPEGPAGAAAGMGSGGGKQRGGGAGDRKADSSRRAKLAAAVGVTQVGGGHVCTSLAACSLLHTPFWLCLPKVLAAHHALLPPTCALHCTLTALPTCPPPVQMVLPFWSGATWDKQHGVAVERRRLLEFTRQMMAAGGAVAGNIWHTATHAEHARPMMQVRLAGWRAGLGGSLAGCDGCPRGLAAWVAGSVHQRVPAVNILNGPGLHNTVAAAANQHLIDLHPCRCPCLLPPFSRCLLPVCRYRVMPSCSACSWHWRQRPACPRPCRCWLGTSKQCAWLPCCGWRPFVRRWWRAWQAPRAWARRRSIAARQRPSRQVWWSCCLKCAGQIWLHALSAMAAVVSAGSGHARLLQLQRRF
jgi:hypothetical protein